ncbi:MAG: GNAT family N-acetyltransferase [Proteobacteria bacterium]|nr:GNAT family N-acetyltransferase [Pseudomonadota bacterium]MBU1140105.1 GNAT family N-acetyltransferase [Pseudomonadota bacterium]
MSDIMSLYGDKLFTRRLALAKIRESDIPTIVTWSQSETACGSYLTPESYNVEQMRAQIRSGVFWKDLEKMFLVELKEEGRPIGTAHYWKATGGRNTIAMALKVAIPEERCKGYGTEIQKFLIMYILEQLQVEAVEMYTDINNTAQQRCLNKLGFELVESLVYEDQGERRTGHLFRLTFQQYKSHPIYQFHYE